MSQFHSSVAISLLDQAHRDDLMTRAAMERRARQSKFTGAALPGFVDAAEGRRQELLAEAAQERLARTLLGGSAHPANVSRLRSGLGSSLIRVGT